MIFVFVSIAIVIIGSGIGCYVSKTKFSNKIEEMTQLSPDETINTDSLFQELDRIQNLKDNLNEIKKNVAHLDIPVPQSVGSYDNAQSSLNKITRFFERHTLATVGAEQVILSLLPTSQIGESVHSMVQIVPPDLGAKIFGDAFADIKDGILSLSNGDSIHRFVEGASNLSHMEKISILKNIEHHNFVSASLTPIKSGVMEVVGVDDATRNIVNSLHDVRNEMAENIASIDVSDLTSASDVDITGHIPVVTIALSSFREFQLLSDDKTNFISSVKNIALDAAGAGIGAAGGAKTGVIVGSMFGPVGAAIGGIIGAVGGAIVGRKVTNEIKMQPLKDAIAEYESQYKQMKADTEEKSKSTAKMIQAYALTKRDKFRNSSVLDEIPITDANQSVTQIALILYQFVVNEMVEMKTKTMELRKSFWFSSEKYDTVISSIEKEIGELEHQLPPVDYIKKFPNKTVDVLLNLDMPNRKSVKDYQNKIEECSQELKAMNDKNNSAVLLWSYMVNNLYQKTMNDIADYSNEQMKNLNQIFVNWRNKLLEKEKNVNYEKGKLGLA